MALFFRGKIPLGSFLLFTNRTFGILSLEGLFLNRLGYGANNSLQIEKPREDTVPPAPA